MNISFLHPTLRTIQKNAVSCCIFLFCLSLGLGMSASPTLLEAAQPQKKQSSKAGTTQQRKASAKKKSRHASKTAKKKAPVTIGNNYKGIILYDKDAQKILFERRQDVEVPPASLTKILSMYVTFDAIRDKKLHLSSLVPISAKAATTGGSRMGIHAGEMIPLRELLKGMAICSGNDASVAVAEYVAGSEEEFVKLMNAKVAALGMKNSVFKNAHGLHVPGQHTTAADMLLLAQNYLQDYPENIEQYHANKQYTYKGKTTRNANSLLGKYDGVNGLKTGYVAAAGYNLITTIKREDGNFISVLLGAPTSKIREQEVAHLLDSHLPNPAPTSKKAQVIAQQK